MNLETHAVKAKSQNLAKFIQHMKGLDASATKIMKMEEELNKTKLNVEEISLIIK